MAGAKKTIEELTPRLPSDTGFVLGYDSTEYVTATIKEIILTLFITFSLVVLVCYIFLQDLRVTLVPVAAIPSLLATFTAWHSWVTASTSYRSLDWCL